MRIRLLEGTLIELPTAATAAGGEICAVLKPTSSVASPGEQVRAERPISSVGSANQTPPIPIGGTDRASTAPLISLVPSLDRGGSLPKRMRIRSLHNSLQSAK